MLKGLAHFTNLSPASFFLRVAALDGGIPDGAIVEVNPDGPRDKKSR